MTRQNLADEAKDRETLRTKHGVELYTPPQAEIDRLTERMRDYWTSWAEQQGPNGVALLREIWQALGRRMTFGEAAPSGGHRRLHG